MTLQLTPGTTATHEPARRPHMLTIAGLAAALALAVGGAAYEFATQRDGTATHVTTSTTAPAVAPVADGPAIAIVQPVEHPIVYLVASVEDAAFLRRLNAEMNALRVDHGLPPAALDVLVTDLDVATIAESAPRAPGTTFVDQRTP